MQCAPLGFQPCLSLLSQSTMAPKEEEERTMMTSGLVIRPPTTTGDNAQPSASLLRDVRRVLALMQDERIMAAHQLLTSVRSRLEEWKRSSSSPSSPSRRFKLVSRRSSTTNDNAHADEHEYRAANDILESKQEELDKLNVRQMLFCLFATPYTRVSKRFVVILSRNVRQSLNEQRIHWITTRDGLCHKNSLGSPHIIEEKKTIA